MFPFTRQAKNVRVIAVGVGKDADSKELTAIAMNDKNHVLKVDQYKDLVKILDIILKESCHKGKFGPNRSCCVMVFDILSLG